MTIYLASKSPRRSALLEQIGISFEVLAVAIDEHWNGHEEPQDYVCRMALEKARAGLAVANQGYAILAADTAVVLEDVILGKAENQVAASSMLTKLSGKRHTVLSAVCLLEQGLRQCEKTLLSSSQVTLKSLSQSEISDYCATGEPIGKAGAYAIQGRAAIFVRDLAGSYSGVMGLPLFETAALLQC